MIGARRMREEADVVYGFAHLHDEGPTTPEARLTIRDSDIRALYERLGIPNYETVLVTERRIYSTDLPIRSRILLKREHRIPRKVYDDALHAIYYPANDFLSLTEDAIQNFDKFDRLYDFLQAKYPQFGMQTRVRVGMWGSEQRVGEVYHRPSTMRPLGARVDDVDRYPSGTPIHFGDRRQSVYVQRHRRLR